MPVPQNISQSVQKYGLSYIRPFHREIARRLVLGQTQGEICKILGISPSRMSIIVNSPLFKLELRRLEQARDEGVTDVMRTLQEIAPIAVETLERLMYKGSEATSFKAATYLLDKTLPNPAVKIEVSNQIDPTMTVDELRRLVNQRLERMKQSLEAKNSESEVINVEYDVLEKGTD